MVPNAEDLKDGLKNEGLNESDGPTFKMKNDPRITKFGKFLRKTSLDELPQIWDIFVGRLSVVGPRPPLPEEVAEYNEYQKQRLAVKGGLICYWQITDSRHDISFDDWVELDLKYIRERSLWVDFKIIVKGFWFVLFNHSGQ
jgi:lipopolysaccharide/colanic/teichoic acid biosynthesis glycosyltransferase